MLCLLDACVLIQAHQQYYAIDRVPEFWEWLLHHGKKENIRVPHEIIEDIDVTLGLRPGSETFLRHFEEDPRLNK